MLTNPFRYKFVISADLDFTWCYRYSSYNFAQKMQSTYMVVSALTTMDSVLGNGSALISDFSGPEKLTGG